MAFLARCWLAPVAEWRGGDSVWGSFILAIAIGAKGAKRRRNRRWATAAAANSARFVKSLFRALPLPQRTIRQWTRTNRTYDAANSQFCFLPEVIGVIARTTIFPTIPDNPRKLTFVTSKCDNIP